MSIWYRQGLQLLFWGLFTGFMIALAAAYGGVSSGPIAISLLVGAGLWSCSEILRATALRCGWLERPPLALIVRLSASILGLSLLLQLVLFVVITLIVNAHWVTMPGSGKADYRIGSVIGYVVNSAFMLVVWTAIWLGRHAWLRARRSELQAIRDENQRQRLELDALKSRLNPHFVFNALNNLRALILEDPERARDMVTQLSNTLRYALYHSRRERVALNEELAVVDDYLAIEAIHFEERLRIRRLLEPSAMQAQLPPMLLQLLVENAIKHGIARTPGGGEVRICAELNERVLELVVRNPGQLEGTPGLGEDAGVGLAYLHTRLRQHWPGAAFSLCAPEPGQVEARLALPQT